ncbi:hypothetical protein C1J03_18535 [Sulfitobacter sp. SK012]|uniref:hypothetical protein n=1 Tax=Sulfitobacter sp. SK012 TaxID=1389005 RepID=UPI000E0C7729|nr:hypothetical protein [Sulfitobacter sp. SK012]AXI47831.1 hypothetical protein C1J03_18535 [Sulfitobacter sp. SK012]
MMLKVILGLGVTLCMTTAVVGYDYSRQMSAHGAAALQLDQYLSMIPDRMSEFAARNETAKPSKLPQVRQLAMNSMDDDWSNMTNEQQIDSMASGSPMLEKMVSADRAASKQRWWDRIRQKFKPEDKNAGNRLADIRARNTPRPRRMGMNPADLANMSPAQIAANMGAIQKGLSTTAINNMNDVVSGMKEAGVDMSVYRSSIYD